MARLKRPNSNSRPSSAELSRPPTMREQILWGTIGPIVDAASPGLGPDAHVKWSSWEDAMAYYAVHREQFLATWRGKYTPMVERLYQAYQRGDSIEKEKQNLRRQRYADPRVQGTP